MFSILRHLADFGKGLFSPAQDPRRVSGGTDRRQQLFIERTRPELGSLREALRTGFATLSSGAGLKSLEELAYEYDQLRPVLDRRKETDPLSVAHVPLLAEETYRHGLSVLEDALELMRVTHSSNRERLEEDAAELEREIESLRGDETQAARLRIRESTVTSHRERLEMIKRQQLRVDELLYQSDRCEASLARTRIEMVALKAGGSEVSVSAVIETLKRTINLGQGGPGRAQRVWIVKGVKLMSKRTDTDKIIRKHVLWSMGAGLVPVPLLDVVAVTAIQMDMLKQLAAVYGASYSASQGKTFVAALTGSTFARVGATMVKALPGIGTVAGGISMSVLSGASTYAVGKIAIDVFHAGGDLLSADLDSAKEAYEEAFEEGKRFASDSGRAGKDAQDLFQALEKLSELKGKGVITEDDFDAQKQKLLDRL